MLRKQRWKTFTARIITKDIVDMDYIYYVKDIWESTWWYTVRESKRYVMNLIKELIKKWIKFKVWRLII